MKRREFLLSTGVTSAGMMFPGLVSQRARGAALSDKGLFNIPRPMDARVNVKPLFGIRIPRELHEGPCRPNDPAGWDRQAEKAKAKQSFIEWKDRTESEMAKSVNLLEPEYVEFAGDHLIDEGTWNRILEQDDRVDMYLLSRYRIPGLGYKTDKPMVMVGNDCSTLDVTAKLDSEGHEIYGAMDMEQVTDLIQAFRVRKALARTKVLVVSDGDWEEKFGFDVRNISIAEMMDHFEARNKDENYLKEAERITSQLVQDAEKNSMSAGSIKDSVMYYLTAKSLMEKYGCNAFSPTCQEFCVSRLPMKYRVTPCLAHSLLKDEGYASGCEGDLNVTFAMAIQICLAERTPYMGNTLVADRESNMLWIGHDVPGRKMKGYAQPDVPYRIVSFTERNWGATLRYDFSRDRGLPVTFCRMSPKLDRMLAVKGIMRDVGGLDQWGCTLKAFIEVPDVTAYFREAQKTGHHFSMVYGDYLRQMRTAADVLNIEMIEIS